ncbi:6008_t:CDS:2, partial [Acaulospora colombiana]
GSIDGLGQRLLGEFYLKFPGHNESIISTVSTQVAPTSSARRKKLERVSVPAELHDSQFAVQRVIEKKSSREAEKRNQRQQANKYKGR